MYARYLLVPLALVAAPATAQETQASAAAKFSREFAALDRNKDGDRKSTRLNSSHSGESRMPSSA